MEYSGTTASCMMAFLLKYLFDLQHFCSSNQHLGSLNQNTCVPEFLKATFLFLKPSKEESKPEQLNIVVASTRLGSDPIHEKVAILCTNKQLKK